MSVEQKNNEPDALFDEPTVESNKKELQEIRAALNTLNNHKLVRNLNSTRRMLALQFLRGAAFGLGSVIGATIVVSLLISFLAQIEFIPIIGEWAVEIMQEIQPELPESPPQEPSSQNDP